MAEGNLENVLGGPWQPDHEPTASPEDQLREQMQQAGIEPPETIHLDGHIHRFSTSKTKKDDAGWYIAFGDGVPAGRFGDFRAGVEGTFRANVGRELTAAEEMAITRRLQEAKEARECERQKRAEVAEDVVTRIWEGASGASPEHPYLNKKGIQPHGARVTGDGKIIVPLYSPEGRLSSLQYIDSEGDKKYHGGGSTKGRFWTIGTIDGAERIYIAEGYATAASVHEATSFPCIVAYSAQNIVPVTETARATHPHARILIVADNDAHGVGQNYANQAAAKYGAEVIIPPTPGDANDYAQAGGDLMSLLQPPQDDYLIQADTFSEKPAPIAWLVKRWIQREALHMVHGPAGSGKTFQVLDWACRLASSLEEWQGQPVRSEPVVYLAGEGHHGLKSRVKAWKIHHGIDTLDMWLSRAGCDLNLPDGYQHVARAIRSLPRPPAAIVVDTLHRFLNGDENSAQDTRSMLDSCAALQAEFAAAVVLVHHTGVSEEAQHRARGSSAWRGALDVEISVVPGKGDRPIELVQRKVKDAEASDPVHVELYGVELPGWVDEDGEIVTSAVAVAADAPPEAPAKDSPLARHKKLFEAAWWHAGAEIECDAPYLSRSALRAKLAADDYKERTIANYCNPAYTDKPIGALILGEVIAPYAHGWIVIDQVMASTMLARKNGE